jgi:2,4-dienoyl-CoA reductase-like NADH-dependent reductase (Old Yellow Enzyme family)
VKVFLTVAGGNGYLLDTFVHNNINNRTDRFGGSLENRLRFPLQVVDAVCAAIGSEKTAFRVAPFHVLQQTLDDDRITTFTRYTQELENRQLAYVHMVEPRYDQLSTEGAFSGKLRERKGAGGDCTECKVKYDEATLSDDFSLWTFREILKTTTLVGAGGYGPEAAREALEKSMIFHILTKETFTNDESRESGYCCNRTIFYQQPRFSEEIC